MKIRLVEVGGKEIERIKEVINKLNYQAEIEEVNKKDNLDLYIKHTPAIIIDNVLISGIKNLYINDLKQILTQFVEA